MLWLAEGIEKLTKNAGVVAAWLVIPLIFATCYEVFSRYVLGTPTIWAFDVGYMLTGTHFLIGGALTLKLSGHIRIDLLYNKFSPKIKSLVDFLGYFLLTTPVIFFLCIELWDYAYEAMQTGEKSGESAWNPVIWPFRLVFFSGFLLLMLQVIAELIRCGRVIVGLDIERGE